MREYYVAFASAAEVHEFVAIATRQFFPIHVERENHRTDAKSIMSLFSMGLNRPLRVALPMPKQMPPPSCLPCSLIWLLNTGIMHPSV